MPVPGFSPPAPSPRGPCGVEGCSPEGDGAGEAAGDAAGDARFSGGIFCSSNARTAVPELSASMLRWRGAEAITDGARVANANAQASTIGTARFATAGRVKKSASILINRLGRAVRAPSYLRTARRGRRICRRPASCRLDHGRDKLASAQAISEMRPPSPPDNSAPPGSRSTGQPSSTTIPGGGAKSSGGREAVAAFMKSVQAGREASAPVNPSSSF